MTPLKFNPYRPGSIVAPGMFSGRQNELFGIERCLFQTKNGNPRHFLIEGERGIGKSSLMLFVKNLASGKLTSSDNSNFNFLVIDIELNSNSTDIEIINKIGATLRSQLMSSVELKTVAKGILDFLSNWKILGIEYKKSGNFLDPIEAIDDLARAVRDLMACVGHLLDGVVLLIDEADKPEVGASKLGEMIKLLTERLTRIGCENVCIGLAGLPTLMPKLRASHESSPRIFESMALGALSIDDRKNVINRGLDIANERIQEKTIINSDAIDMLAIVSEGYPHFLQEFAYASFEEDKDNIISVVDVQNSIFKSGGAIYQLGKRYFESMYYEKISSPDYRKVLQGMASYLDSWLTRQEIAKLSGVRETQLNNALVALRSRNIILYNDEKRGEYRLPTRSFAVWLKILGEKADEVLGSDDFVRR
jgi:hypothetical protein